MDRKALFSDRKVVFLVATFCCFLWGSAYPGIKNGYALFGIAQGDVPGKLLFAGWRFLAAGLVLLAIAGVGRAPLSLGPRRLGQLTVLGLTQTALQYTFFYVGLAYTTGARGSILNATTTFFSVLLAHFVYRNDRLSLRRTLACLIGFAGVMVVNFGDGLRDFAFTLQGEGSVVASAFVLAAAQIYGKRLSQSMDATVMTGYQLSFGGAALLIAGYAAGGSLTGFTVVSSALLLYLVLLSSAAFALWSVLLKYNAVGRIAVFNFLIPIFGVALSALFLDESVLQWKNLLALTLVCLGIWLVARERPPR